MHAASAKQSPPRPAALLPVVLAIACLAIPPIPGAEAGAPEKTPAARVLHEPAQPASERPEMGRCPSEEPAESALPPEPITASAGLGLNDWERAKLELARAAVAQAESDGTRATADDEEPSTLVSPEEAEAAKLQLLRAPREMGPDLIDLLSRAPIQEEESR